MIEQGIQRGTRTYGLPSAAVVKLHAMIAEISTGIASTGLLREFRPQQIIDVADTLHLGTSQSISYVMRDIAGEAVSLSAGTSVMGPKAIEALSDAQSDCMVSLRARNRFFAVPTAICGAQAMLNAHVRQLLYWVQTGVIPDEYTPSDLTRIGQEYLQTPDVRQAAIATFVASAAIIETSLGLFASQK